RRGDVRSGGDPAGGEGGGERGDAEPLAGRGAADRGDAGEGERRARGRARAKRPRGPAAGGHGGGGGGRGREGRRCAPGRARRWGAGDRGHAAARDAGGSISAAGALTSLPRRERLREPLP